MNQLQNPRQRPLPSSQWWWIWKLSQTLGYPVWWALHHYRGAGRELPPQVEWDSGADRRIAFNWWLLFHFREVWVGSLCYICVLVQVFVWVRRGYKRVICKGHDGVWHCWKAFHKVQKDGDRLVRMCDCVCFRAAVLLCYHKDLLDLPLCTDHLARGALCVLGATSCLFHYGHCQCE